MFYRPFIDGLFLMQYYWFNEDPPATPLPPPHLPHPCPLIYSAAFYSEYITFCFFLF